MQELLKRSVDKLGRIVLPLEVRTELKIDPSDDLFVCIDGMDIVLKKTHSFCYICKKTDNLTDVDNKSFCSDCIAKIKAIS